MSFMDFVSGGLAGAGGALENVGSQMGKTAAEMSIEDHRNEAQRQRDARMNEYLRQNEAYKGELAITNAPRLQAAQLPGELALAEGKSSIAVNEAKAKPRTIAAGATEKTGDTTFTAPEKPMTVEQRSYYTAWANRLNADADAIREGSKNKPVLPKFDVIKDANGNPTGIVDQNSGAVGTITPAQEAVPGKAHLFSADEPGKPAQPQDVQWTYNGRPLQNGIADLYPDMRKRAAGAGGESPQTVPPFSKIYGADLEAAAQDPAAYKKLLTITGGSKQRLDAMIANWQANPDAEVKKPVAKAAPAPAQSPATVSQPSVMVPGDTYQERATNLLQKRQQADQDPELMALDTKRKVALRNGRAIEASRLIEEFKALRQQKYGF